MRGPLLDVTFSSNADSLSAIICDGFIEPGMLQGLFGRYSTAWIVDENLFEKVEELPVEGIIIGKGYDLLSLVSRLCDMRAG